MNEKLTPHVGVKEGMWLQGPLLDKEFEEAYDLLHEHWEESVREKVPEEELKG